MNLLEYQGKELLKKYAIPVPDSFLMYPESFLPDLSIPFFLKSQVAAGDRNKYGGIVQVESAADFISAKEKLFKTPIAGLKPDVLLAEKKIGYTGELYLSFSYDTRTRAPALSLARQGGSGVAEACVFPIDIVTGLQDFFIRDALLSAGLPLHAELKGIIQKLWRLFESEHALVAEINPLFATGETGYIAGDAKIILDDYHANPEYRPFIDLPGDIAIIASGGGASMLNIDALMHAGGKPANYAEYSGNPPASVVEELTVRILTKPGLKGCWVIGGTANFTDIYETMLGFVAGLRKISPKPDFPIVIRRDGPRREEAFQMLQEVASREGYTFSLFGPEVPMAYTAEYLVKKIYEHSDR
ncbi:MAG: hypothetical protein HY617_01075 [Candidatus Sungbacteria bacterium]|nr:hypothetical protein [Candidatus Sungbacteria bacterium]